jgi:hypothetical protein
MKVKTAVLGFLVSAMVAVPVVAQVHQNVHPIATSATWYSHEEFPSNPPSGIFANWTTHSHQSLLSFGLSTSAQAETVVGVRVDAPSGQRGKTWSMDVNTTQGSDPFFMTFFVAQGASAPTLANFSFIESPGALPVTQAPIFESPSPFTVSNAGRGFSRYTFNANAAGMNGGAFSSIYFADLNGRVSTFQDAVTNIVVNGTAAFANIQPTPEFDSTLDF